MPVNNSEFPNPALAYPFQKGDKGDKGDPGGKGDKGDVGGVTSVAGRLGDVVLTPDDAGAEPAGAVAAHVEVADPHGDRAAAAEALAGHAGAVDPHPQYTTAAELATATGAVQSAAALDATGKANAAQAAAIAASVPVSALGVTVATLVAGVVPTSQIPAIAITEYLGAVASQAAMLALVGQRGDWCTRTDRGSNFQLIADNSALIGSWLEHVTPASPVSSVNGQVGPVVLGKGDIGLGNVDNTPDAAKPVSVPQAAALAGHVAAVDPHGDRAAASAALAAHAGAADPHAQYLSKTAAQAALDANSTADRNRANHGGSQTADTISDLSTAVLAIVAASNAAVGEVTVAQLLLLNPADYPGVTLRLLDMGGGSVFVIALDGRWRPWQNSAVVWQKAGDHNVLITGDGSALLPVPGSQFSFPGVLLGPTGRLVLYVDASFPDDANSGDAFVWTINGNSVFAYSASSSLETYGALASWGNRGTVNAQEGGGTGNAGSGLGNSSANFPGVQTVQTTINTDAVTLASEISVRGPAGGTVNVRRMCLRWEV